MLIICLWKINLKAYSLMVERTAHNGTNVGSNPTKPTEVFL